MSMKLSPFSGSSDCTWNSAWEWPAGIVYVLSTMLNSGADAAAAVGARHAEAVLLEAERLRCASGAPAALAGSMPAGASSTRVRAMSRLTMSMFPSPSLSCSWRRGTPVPVKPKTSSPRPGSASAIAMTTRASCSSTTGSKRKLTTSLSGPKGGGIAHQPMSAPSRTWTSFRTAPALALLS